MKEKVLNNIIRYDMINTKDTVVVGVSGGHDSMCLLHVLNSIKEELDFQIVVCHINHGVRGEYALRDEMFVKEYSESLGLEFYSLRKNMNDYAKEKKISPEEAGRLIRYGFFNKVLSSYKNGKIAVAHNSNDQVETIIMRMIRGTGLDGLVGINFKVDNVIRPILNVTRDEIESYIERNNIPVVIDHTNLETDYTRNKIRLELIPYIEENFNPNFSNSILRLCENVKSEVSFLEDYTILCYNEMVINSNKDKVVLNNKKLINLDKNIKRRVIRHAIDKLTGSLQGFEMVHIDNIIDLSVKEDTGKFINLPGDLTASLDYNNLTISFLKSNTIDTDYLYDLQLGKNYISSLNLEIELSIIDKEDISKFNKSKSGYIYFDFDKVKGNIKVRNRRNGDRFTPFGMTGSKKIKDFFIDEKIPRDEREKIPMLVDDENIIYVLNYRLNENYKITKVSKKIMLVKVKECF